MGLFGKKETCCVCGKDVGFNKSKTAEGWLCPDCYKHCGYKIGDSSHLKTVAEIKEDMKAADANLELLKDFRPTKQVGFFIEFDEKKRQWLIPDGFMGKKLKAWVYSFDDIIEYELIENGASVTKGGIGRAVVGGLLFGGVGAVVGGVTGKKTNTVVNSMQIKITVNNFSSSAVTVDLISTQTKVDSGTYKNACKYAQEILSTLALIVKQNESKVTAATPQDSSDEDSIFCNKCGKKMPGDSVFCSKCGTKIA